MFASSPNNSSYPRRGTPTSSSTPMNNNNNNNPLASPPQFRNNMAANRATTPPPSSSSPSTTNLVRKSNIQNHNNRPTQISFTGFGSDDKNIPGNSSHAIGRKAIVTHEEDCQNKNFAYLGAASESNPILQADNYQSPPQPSSYHHHQQELPQQPRQVEAGSPEYLHQYYEDDRKLQKCFQSDIKAAQPLFSARQIATRHLNSGFQLFAGSRDAAVLFTDRMLQLPHSYNRGASVISSTSNFRGISSPPTSSSARNASVLSSAVPEVTASPTVIDYHDDVGHGKRTLKTVRLERRQQGKDDARAFVERNGISILGRMQNETQSGSSNDALPGLMNRKNRDASPASSHTHLSGMGQVTDCDSDGSKFKFCRKVHPEQLHHSNLTRSLLPVRRIKTPSVNILASPPRSARTTKVGVGHLIDTNRVLCPDMIPESRTPRLRSLRPPEMLGQGMEIKEGAPQWAWKGGLRGDFWRHEKPTDPFGGEP